MKTHNELKKHILDNIKAVSFEGDWYELSGDITGSTIQQALDKYKNVSVPDIGKPIVVEEPIILSSDMHLKVAENQIIMQSRTSETCLLRNEHIQNGAFGVTDRNLRDKNISVEGGIWNFKKSQRFYHDKTKSIKGALSAIILCGVEQIHLSNMRIFDNEELCGRGTTSSSYGIQICDCRDFIVENIDFCNNSRDGVHVNGPAEYGHIKNIRAAEMGDDMVALNAWDWDTSAITFGAIEHIVVEDIKGGGNEFRILPGQKIFSDGTRLDCDIRNCVLENLSGVYTFKLYAQPNIANVVIGSTKNDVSGTVGVIEDLFVKNVLFNKMSESGFNAIPVKSLFEICSDCSRLHLEDIFIDNTKQQCAALDVKLINVGPLSAVWTNGSENPEDWGEVFDPDAICHAEDIYLDNICFAGTAETDVSELVREVKMTINTDYPNTIPKGGTGYGTIGKVHMK